MVTILTLLIGLYYAYKNNIEAFLYVQLFCLFFLQMIVNWTEPSLFQYKGYVPIILIIALLIFNIGSLLKNEVLIDGIKVIGLIILPFILLLYLSSLFNNYEFLSAVTFFRNYFWPFLLFVLVISLSNGNIRIERIILFIVCIQITLCILQYFGGSYAKNLFSIQNYTRNGEVVNFMSESVYTKSHYLIVGTLGHVTRLATFLSWYIVYYYMKKVNENSFGIYSFLIIAFSLICILLSGVRAPFVICVCGLLVCYIVFNTNISKKIIKTSLIIFIAFITLPVLINIGKEQISKVGGSYENGLYRSLTVFGVLGELQEGEVKHQYTTKRTIYLSNFLTPRSFVIGTGIYMKDEKGYGKGIRSITDAQLLFILVEFGILIFIFCLVPYIISIREIKKVSPPQIYKIFILFFSIILLQTLVDQGIFDTLTSFMFFIICGCEVNNNYFKYMAKQSTNSNIDRDY